MTLLDDLRRVLGDAYRELFVPCPQPQNVRADSALFYAGVYLSGLNLWNVELYVKENHIDAIARQTT